MEARELSKIVEGYFPTARYKVPNVYFFGSYWETDLLIVQNSGLVFDIEIKISRSDFFADFKKAEKHSTLCKPHLLEYCPNKFYFAVPKDLVSIHEVPKYAGLLYVDGYRVIEAKKAPYIHKEKIEHAKRLVGKFYVGYNEYRYFKDENGLNLLKNTVNKLREENWDLKHNNQRLSNQLRMIERYGMDSPSQAQN